MSDTYRRYRAIKRAMLQFFQPCLGSHAEKHLNTLCALICGLAGGQHAHLPTIADHAPSNGASQESLIKRFRRFLQREQHTLDGFFLPVAQQLLSNLAKQPLRLVMDGSVVGRGCMALMVRVVYHGRALPLAWVVVSAPKGHVTEQTHRALLAQVQAIMPAEANVIFLGDGEFDGIELQADLRAYGWSYVCRTASNMLVSACGVEFHTADLGVAKGACVAVRPAWMTASKYGPISILAVWETGYDKPLYLVTNMFDVQVALAEYKKRAHIETFFSDQKSRGFQIDKSHLSAPERLSRLLIGSCLASIWLVYLGVCAIRDDWMGQLHRQDRCDLSLFRLGVRLLARALKERLPIPEGFLVPVSLPLPRIRSFVKQAA